jgi:hypothetical protein
MLDFLQYPGCGPIVDPPKQIALSELHSLQSVGSVGTSNKYVPLGHSYHAPLSLSPSPANHDLTATPISR